MEIRGRSKHFTKTLVGQSLPFGKYILIPGRGTADGIVDGNITLEIK